MLGEHEVWPAEAETLPQAERETIMAKLWDTLTRKLPWNSREFCVASAKAIKENRNIGGCSLNICCVVLEEFKSSPRVMMELFQSREAMADAKMLHMLFCGD